MPRMGTRLISLVQLETLDDSGDPDDDDDDSGDADDAAEAARARRAKLGLWGPSPPLAGGDDDEDGAGDDDDTGGAAVPSLHVTHQPAARREWGGYFTDRGAHTPNPSHVHHVISTSGLEPHARVAPPVL